MFGRSPKAPSQSWRGSDVWKSEIENYTPFDKKDAKTYYVRGPYIEHPSLTGESAATDTVIPQASIAPYTGPRTILVNCPGGKIPVRTSASVKADIVRYIGAGDKIIIYPKAVAGFFQLVDDGGFVNKSTRGVVWEDVTKIPTNEASTTGLEGSAASPTPVLGIVLPPVTAGVVSSTPPISDTSENASFSNKVTHAPTPTSPFDIPDEIPAATDDTLVGVSGLTATTVTVAAAANIASAKEMSNPQPETDAEAWARVEREAAVASRAETVEKLIRKSARIKQEVGEHVAQDSRTRAQSKGIASTTNPTKLIKAAKRSRMNFNMAVVGPGGIGKSTLLQSLFEDFVPTVHTMVHPRSMVAGEEVSGGVTALSFLGSLEASNDEGDPVDITLLESVNYSDNVDNSAAVGALHDLLLAEHENYLNLDLHDMTADEAALSDTRIHCVLYLLAPHSFTTLDAKFIEQISPLAPVIPVVNKADAMTDQERDAFLLKVREKIDAIAEDLGQPVIYNFDASAQDGVLKADPGSIFATICEDSSDERVYLWGKPGQTWRPSDLGTLQESLFESNTHMTGLIRSTHQKTISLLRMRRMQQEQQRLEAEAEVQKQAEERRVAESAQRLVLQLEEESRLKETENAVIAKRSQSFSYYFSRSSSKTAPTARGSSSARGALVSAAGSPVSSTDNPLSPQSASASQASASKKDCMIQ